MANLFHNLSWTFIHIIIPTYCHRCYLYLLTAPKGTEQYNQKLSERRAEAVKHYLIKEGAADNAKISARGYGKSRPIAPNKTKGGKDNPAGRAENRRVEILIISE